MKTYIALFRGINVGGRNVLPMKELVALLEGLGFGNVRTYIQSGNAVLRSTEVNASKLSRRITAAVKRSHGFEPRVLLLGFKEFQSAIVSNPFPEAERDPKTLHVNFLAAKPANPDLKKLERLKTDRERFALRGRVFYLHAPNGIGRSKLAANAESLLGVPMTGRNWRTVCKIVEMAREATDG